MLAINDQIASGSGVETQPQVVRVGIPNIHAPAVLGGIVREGMAFKSQYRLQVRCDHSHGLLRSVRSGYLELAATQFMNEGDQANALSRWMEDLVWVKARGFVLKPDQPVPLVSSPNLLLPDRLGMAALETANRPYEIVFIAFDTLARRAAAAAGLGYFAIPRSAVSDTLVIETPGVLPELPQIHMGIVARDDLDTRMLGPLIKKIEELFSATRQD
jgi:DNA-binding transcriptional LysR family regulator